MNCVMKLCNMWQRAEMAAPHPCHAQHSVANVYILHTACVQHIPSYGAVSDVSDVVMIAAIKIVFNVFMNATKPDLFTRYFLCSRRWLALYK